MSGKRYAFRPSVGDVLEQRLVMSHTAATAVHAAAVHAAAVPNVPNTPPSLGPVGVLGDSYSDEYRFYPPDRSAARNWVEILHALREVSFGPYTTASRGTPRNQGFAYNWALSDATSVGMVTDQLPGLTKQVAANDIRYVSMFIGGNDFLHVLYGVQDGAIPAAEAIPTLFAAEAQLEADVSLATTTILSANPNVKLVMWTLPNVAILPIAQAGATTPQAKEFLQLVGQEIDKFNAFVTATAATSPRIGLVDLAGVTAGLVANPTGTLSFGNENISLLVPGDAPNHFFLADGIHVGTIGQSIIADEFVSTIDADFGAGLFPVLPQEAIHYANLIYARFGHTATATA